MPIELRDFVFANLARSTLASAIAAADTELTIITDEGATFPSADQSFFVDDIFAIVLHGGNDAFEVCYCIARSGDVLTVERAREDTVAQDFSAGTLVIHTVTRGFLEQVVARRQAAAPSAPVLSGEESGGNFNMTWTASVPASGDFIREYQIYRQTDGGAFTLLATVDGDVLTYLDDTLVGDSVYYWYVVGVGFLGGASTASNQVTFVVDYIDSLCFNDTAPASTYVISPPALAAAGDLLVMALRYASSTNGMTAPAGWNKLTQFPNTTNWDDDLARNAGTGPLFMAYRFMQEGDSTWSITLSGSAPRLFGCVHAFRNVDTNRPIAQMMGAEDNPNGSVSLIDPFVATPPMNSCGPGSKVISFTLGRYNIDAEMFGSLQFADTPEYSSAAQQSESGGTARRGLITLLYDGAIDEQENLIPYSSQNLASWVATQMGVTDDFGSGRQTEVDPTNSTSGRHEISTTVSLVAGRTYTLMVPAGPRTNTSTDFTYITVDNGITEIGATYDKNSNSLSQNGDIGAGFTREYAKKVGQTGTTERPNSAVAAVFTATVTGTHTIRIGWTQTAGSATSTYLAAFDGGFHTYVMLYEGERLQTYDLGLRTTGAAVTGVSGMQRRIAYGMLGDGSIWNTFALEIRRSGAVPDRVRLYNALDEVDHYLAAGRLSVLSTELFSTTAECPYIANAGIDPWQHSASGQFYFEMTCDSAWESDTTERTAVGVCLPWGFDVSQINDPGFYGYGNRGSLYQDDTVVGTVDTYTVGDVVGVAVDFLASTVSFYKNGILQGSVTIDTNHLSVPLRAMIINSTTSSDRPVTLNFSGPFAFTKPVGFVAYDWEYEP